MLRFRIARSGVGFGKASRWRTSTLASHSFGTKRIVRLLAAVIVVNLNGKFSSLSNYTLKRMLVRNKEFSKVGNV